MVPSSLIETAEREGPVETAEREGPDLAGLPVSQVATQDKSWQWCGVDAWRA